MLETRSPHEEAARAHSAKINSEKLGLEKLRSERTDLIGLANASENNRKEIIREIHKVADELDALISAYKNEDFPVIDRFQAVQANSARTEELTKKLEVLKDKNSFWFSKIVGMFKELEILDSKLGMSPPPLDATVDERFEHYSPQPK